MVKPKANKGKKLSKISEKETTMRNGGDWGEETGLPGPIKETKNKRKRRSTGGTFENTNISVSKQDFKSMNTDDKLVTLFDMMTKMNAVNDTVHVIQQQVHEIENKQSEVERRLKTVEYKSIDAEARSRSLNLIFRGFPEEKGEDCDSKIADLIEDYLELDTIKMGVNSVKRLGFAQRDKTRPIIVRFKNEEDVQIILENAYKLAGTVYGINRDYPKEIVEARSRLWQKYKTEKESNPRRTVKIAYPAKLIVRGQVVQDEFPDWNEVLKSSRAQPDQPAQSLPNDTAKANQANRTKIYVARNHNTSSRPTIISENRFANLEVESNASTPDSSMNSEIQEACSENEGDLLSESQPIHNRQKSLGNKPALKGRQPRNDKTLHYSASASASGGPSDILIPT
jgi:hypothetical protein